ncbi:MAG: GDSL-type esterase/lipase family protein [Cyanobacteria bacterium J06648_11]
MFHGHSVPAGYFQTPEIRPFDSYPHLTHRLVQKRYPTSMTEFIRTAIGGEHSEAGAARFSRDVLSLRPDVVCIDYALNDRAIGLERAEQAWIRMIEPALSNGVKVILFTPTADLAADESSPDQSLPRHAQQIRELAERYDVGLVDSFTAFQQYGDEHGEVQQLMSQSNHPNRDGHSIVAGLLATWFIPPHEPTQLAE